MKNFGKHIWPYLFIVLALAITSCNDDNDDLPANRFELDGQTYALSSGFLEDFGSNGNGTFDFDIFLSSSGISYNSTSGFYVGSGDGIYLDLNTTSETGLLPGTYNFSNNRTDFTFSDASVYLDFSFTNVSGTLFAVTGGTVTIGIDGSTTTIEFTLNLSNGQTATGIFSGVLTPV